MILNRLIFVLLLFVSMPYVYVEARTIEFSGITWYVKTGNGRGPGPNNWSENPSNVWVDADKRLHLTIKKVNGVWYSTEINTLTGFGYGEYKLYLASNVNKYDMNTVVGFFTYENDNREIDIEFARWGSPTYGPGSYTVQSAVVGKKASTHSFPLTNFMDGISTTHKFIWTKDNINFQSFLGHDEAVSPFQNWNYKGINNPPAGAEKFHINFWLFQGLAPTNSADVELVIDSITIANCLYKQTLSPSNARWRVGNGAWKKSDESIFLKAGTHTVEFESISGYSTPTSKVFIISQKQSLVETTIYNRETGLHSFKSPEILFSVFPAIANNFVNISTSSRINEDVVFTIMSVSGSIYQNSILNFRDDNFNTINISQLSAGIYFLKFDTSKGSTVTKLIKK